MYNGGHGFVPNAPNGYVHTNAGTPYIVTSMDLYTAMASQNRSGAAITQPQYGMPSQHQQTYMPPQFSQMQPPIFYGGGQPTSAVKAVPANTPAQREKKVIPIINPDTNKNIFDDVQSVASKPSQPSSPTQSQDSSASATPALRASPPDKVQSSNIPAQFALQVSQAVNESDEKSEIVDKPHTDEDSASSISTTNDSNNISHDELINDSRDVNCRLSTSCVDSNVEISRNVPEMNDFNKQATNFSAMQSPPQTSRSDKQPEAALNTTPTHEKEPDSSQLLRAGVTSYSPKDPQQKDMHLSLPLPPLTSQQIQVTPIKTIITSEDLATNINTNEEDASLSPMNVQQPKAEIVNQPQMQKSMGYPPPHIVAMCPPPSLPQNRFSPPYSMNFQTPPPLIDQFSKEAQSVLAESIEENIALVPTTEDIPSLQENVVDSTIEEESLKTASTSGPQIQSAPPVSLKEKIVEPYEPFGKRVKEKTDDDKEQATGLSAELPIKGEEEASKESCIPEPSQSIPEPGAATDNGNQQNGATSKVVPIADESHKTDTSQPKKKKSEVSVTPPSVNKDISDEVSEMNAKNSATKPKPVDPVIIVDPNAKLSYDRQFLLELGKRDISRKRPEALPNLEVVLDGPSYKLNILKPKVIEDFTPTFMQQGSRNRLGGGGGGQNMQYMQQKPMGGRGSQQGRRQQKVIDIKLSSSSEVKLKTTENAWKPGVKKPDEVVKDDQDGNMEELKKKMRGILNKLTPENFDKLVVRVKTFPIENYNHLDGIISLIFDKAVDEQGFSATYSQLCQVLSQMTVKDTKDASNKQDGTSEKVKDARFKNLIITKCQKEFEKDNAKDDTLLEMKQDLEKCAPEKKARLTAIYNYEELKLRKRSVGNIRFIGELYKLKMLTSPIMMRIITGLLSKKDEESLECLCKLMTTIGQMLEMNATTSKTATEELNARFRTINNIVSEKNTSSRVRFLLMDVLDLRANRWVPRREVTKPKTKAEVHEEIRREEAQLQHQILMSSNTPRRNDGRNDDRSRERKKSRGNPMDDGWNTVGNMNTRRHQLDSVRLNKTVNQFNMHGGSMAQEGHREFAPNLVNWARGSSGGAGAGAISQEDATSNRFNVLDETSMTVDARRSNAFQAGPRFAPGGPYRQVNFASKSMPSPAEKDYAVSAIKKPVIPNDRSKSNSRSNSRESSQSKELKVNKIPTLTNDEYQVAVKKIIEQLASNDNYQDASETVKRTFSVHTMALFIRMSLDENIDKNLDRRRLLGKFYQFLLQHNILNMEQFVEGTRESLEMVDDLMIDIPQIRQYYGDVFGLLLLDTVMQLEELIKVLDNVTEIHRPCIFTSTLRVAQTNIGQKRLVDMLKSFNWTLLLPKDTDVTQFLKDNELSLCVDPTQTSEVKRVVDPKQLRKDLLELFKRAVSDEQVFAWIEAHVTDIDKPFVRALTVALVESLMTTSDRGSSLTVGEGFAEKLENKVKIIHKYVDNNEHLELPCLFGIQSLCVETEHPPGLIERCCSVFYESEVLSEDCFKEWEKNTDVNEQLGKGVCVTYVRKFLTWIQEFDAEETDVSTSQTMDQIEERTTPK